MRASLEDWKNWENRVVADKFPLRQWLGGSERSAVFLTARQGAETRNGMQKAAIKLVMAGGLDEDAQLSRWAKAAKFSHPHILRLYEWGRGVLDDRRFLYVVMEFADEELSQILPVRPLSSSEALEMLQPTVEALSALQRAGLAHGSIKPANIMAADNQLKLSADCIGEIGERSATYAGVYDAPEVAAKGISPAADIWSLGATLVAVLTQREPLLKKDAREPIAIGSTIPQPFGEIARECLQDEEDRCTAEDILRRIKPVPVPAPATAVRELPPEPKPRERSMRLLVAAIVAAALLIVLWIGRGVRSRQESAPAAQSGASAPTLDARVANSSPLPAKPAPPSGAARGGSVRQRVMPEVSRGALNTIRGHVKVSVQVAVDASGNVQEAKLVSAGPSRYFATRSLEAARGWKFNPPQGDGQAGTSEWMLRFQFGLGSVQAFPEELRQ